MAINFVKNKGHLSVHKRPMCFWAMVFLGNGYSVTILISLVLIKRSVSQEKMLFSCTFYSKNPHISTVLQHISRLPPQKFSSAPTVPNRHPAMFFRVDAVICTEERDSFARRGVPPPPSRPHPPLRTGKSWIPVLKTRNTTCPFHLSAQESFPDSSQSWRKLFS